MARAVKPQTMRAWRAFLEAHARLTERLDSELRRETGLTLSHYDVLVQLAEAPQRQLRMSGLAAAVLLSKSGLTRLVDRMCAAGLVAREEDPVDGRATLVTLTAAGTRALQAAAPVHLRGVAQYFGAALRPKEAEAMAAGLGRAARALAPRDEG